MTSAPQGLRLGTTLFSFTNEYHSRRYTVEQLIDKVAELGSAPALEILGFSHIREYPGSRMNSSRCSAGPSSATTSNPRASP